MAPRKKHLFTVIVFDVNSNEAFREEAEKAYSTICAERLTEVGDCCQLILINTEETSNRKNDNNSKMYKNIVEATEIIPYNPKTVKHIKEAIPSPGNWLEGIQVAVAALSKGAEDGRFDMYQLIVLSDLKTEIEMDKKDVTSIIKNIRMDLNEIEGYIYFLGVEVPIENMLSSKKDVYEAMQNLSMNGSDTNVKIATQILEETLGVMSDITIGLDLIHSFKNGKRGYPFVEPLRFDDLEFYTSSVKFLDCQSLLSLKRDKDGMVEKKYVFAEDQSEEVDYSNIIGGIALHNKLVIIPPDVNKGVKEYARFFKLLGFTDMANIPEDYMLASSTNIITVYEMKDPEMGVINYVIKACHKLQKYGIALKAHMKNCRPKLFCLIPKLDPLCFIAVELPYAEDINIAYATKDCDSVKFNEKAYSDYVNVEELKDDIYAYLDGMGMEGNVKLHPNLRKNFSQRKIAANLLRKINGEELIKMELPVGELRIEPPEDLYEKINKNWFAKNQKLDKEEEETF